MCPFPFLIHPPTHPPQAYTFKVSYLEIYNEQLRDLLCPQTHFSKIQVRPSSSFTHPFRVLSCPQTHFSKIQVNTRPPPLSPPPPPPPSPSTSCVLSLLYPPTNSNPPIHPPQVLDDKDGGVIIKGLKEEEVGGPAHALALIALGEDQRHIGATDLNAESSRSHTIFRMTIESRPVEGVGPLRSSILSLIDLAGSENAKLTNASGGRQREGQYINKSLLALGHVIQKLSDAAGLRGGGGVHVPFRDSKLTRFLQVGGWVGGFHSFIH